VRLGKIVTPIGAIGGLFGLDASNLLKTYFDDMTAYSASHAKKEASAALSRMETPVLVIMDDLDRLTSDELMQVFKLVRLVGRLPHVYYLLSYDEQTLIDLLAKTDLVGGGHQRRALDYLEKIVQIRLDLPPLRGYQIERLVEGSIRRLVTNHSLQFTAIDRDRFHHVFVDVLRERLSTIRAIRRYFGQVDALLPSVVGEVDFVDFLTLSWLRTNEPAVYSIVHAHKLEVLGNRGISLRHLTAEQPEVARARWVEMIKRAGVADHQVDDIMYLVGTLFPAMKQINDLDKRTSLGEAIAGRVSHPHYFDRFFAFGVPAEDLRDSVVAEGLRQLRSGEHGSAFKQLDGAARSDTGRTMSKVSADLATKPIDPRLGGAWLASVYADVTESDGLSYEQQQIVTVLSEVFIGSTVEMILESLPVLARTDAGLELTASAVQLLGQSQYGRAADVELKHEVGQALMPSISELIASRFDASRDVNPLRLSDAIWNLVWPWSAIGYADMRRFFDSQLEDNRWPVLDTLARLVSTTVSTSDSPSTIAGFEFRTVNAFVDIAAATRTLSAQISSNTQNADDFHHVRTTDEARRQFVLATLQRWNASQSEGALELKE
ncbi:MAG: P-loop NTPase fold protein, partial [Mycetocola sp.]